MDRSRPVRYRHRSMPSSTSLLFRLLPIATIAGLACSFPPLPPLDVDAAGDRDGGDRDGRDIDARADGECVPDTVVCDDATGHYVACSPTGEVELSMDCPLGCAPGVEKCLDIDPSNGLAAQLDLTADAPDVTFAPGSTINTTTGAIGGASQQPPTALVNDMRILRFNALTISGSVKITGTYPVVLLANGPILITDILDVSADGVVAGPGALPTGASCSGGSIDAPAPSPGGGGGGRAQAGAPGGRAGDNSLGGAGGSQHDDPDIVPLQGGCRGGTSRESSVRLSSGGGGGGAVQIVSRVSISFATGGKVDASGGGAQFSTLSGTIGGGGGGSGGGVLLEAPQIVLDGAGVVISTKGGSGAAGNTDGVGPGNDGGTGAAAAPGGTSPGNPSGGDGGTASLAPTSGANGTTADMDGAGGGGSVGQARFNNLGGAIVPLNGAAIRSRFTTDVIRTRQVP
jgi:hypothetical protein